MFDQMAPQSLPMYGHKVVKTPNLQSLANDGVVFENAYCNSPLCAPSRFSMMSGKLCSKIGAYDNAAEFHADIPTFVHYLRSAGYRTVLSGKMHFVGPDQLHGFEKRLTTDIYPADFGWTPDWTNRDKRWFWYHNMQSVVESGVYSRTLELDYDEEVCYQAVRHLYDTARDDDSRAFFLTTSFIQPHDPYMTPQACWNHYDHDEIDMPAVRPIPLAEQDPHSQRLYYACQMDQYRITDEHVKNARHAYYGMISWLDEQVGRLLQALEDTGQRDDTIIFVTSDHGDMLGERGLWYKMSFFERSIRVPLIVHAPKHFRSNRIRENVSLADLLPTVVEIANDGALELASPVDGQSLLPLLHGRREAWSDLVLGEYLAEGTCEPVCMVKHGPFKYITCESDPPLLYNLDTDPQELKTLAGYQEHAQTEASLREIASKYWNSAAIRSEVIESQQRRLFLQETMKAGDITSWDFQPQQDASAQYNRNYHDELFEADRRARIPYREPPPFDGDATDSPDSTQNKN